MVSVNPMLVNPLLNGNYIPSDSLEKATQKAVSLEQPALKSEKNAKTASSQKTKIAFVAGLALGVLGGYLLRGVQNANTGQVNLCARPPVSCPAPVSCPSSVRLHNDSMLQGIVFKALQSETQGQNNPQSQLPILPTISLPTELLSSTPQSSPDTLIAVNASLNKDSTEVQQTEGGQQFSQLDRKIEQLAKDAPVCTDPGVQTLEEKANASQQIMDYFEVGRQYSKLGDKNPGFYHKAVYWFYQGAKQGDISCMRNINSIINKYRYPGDKSIYRKIWAVYEKANDKIIETLKAPIEKRDQRVKESGRTEDDNQAFEESRALANQCAFRAENADSSWSKEESSTYKTQWYGEYLFAYRPCWHRQCSGDRGNMLGELGQLKKDGEIDQAQYDQMRARAYYK